MLNVWVLASQLVLKNKEWIKSGANRDDVIDAIKWWQKKLKSKSKQAKTESFSVEWKASLWKFKWVNDHHECFLWLKNQQTSKWKIGYFFCDHLLADACLEMCFSFVRKMKFFWMWHSKAITHVRRNCLQMPKAILFSKWGFHHFFENSRHHFKINRIFEQNQCLHFLPLLATCDSVSTDEASRSFTKDIRGEKTLVVCSCASHFQ